MKKPMKAIGILINMKNFRVTFFKLEREKNAQGKMVVVGKEYLGSVDVDDSGVDNNNTLASKAFRRANDICATLGESVSIQEIKL